MNLENIDEAINKPKSLIDISKFTKDQQKAYSELINFINSDYNPNDYKRALVGAAGTGKTYLLKSIVENCKLSYSTIGLAAPTHKACRVLSENIKIPNIKINTLQSDLGLRLNFNIDDFDINNPPFDPRGKIKLNNYKIYIIDESSMIPAGLVKFLETIAKQNNTKLIYVGDSYQLFPAKEHSCAAFKGIKTVELKEIVRQESDNSVKYLLDLLRYDIEHKTYKFLEYINKHRENFDINNVKGYKVCNNTEFLKYIGYYFGDEQLTHNVDFCKIVAYTNERVSYWNKYIRNLIIKDADKSIITRNDLFISYVTIVNQFNECILKNSEEYIINDVVNYVHPKYNIKGFMVKFTAIYGGQVTPPIFIIDHSDKYSVMQYIKTSQDLVNAAKNARSNIRANYWKEYFQFKESCLLLTNINNNMNKLLYGRNLDYGFCLTAHKSQGSTFDSVLVDVNNIIYDIYGNPRNDIETINRLLYVACSRCKNKLYLLYG